MSRVGNKPITLPQGVNISVEGLDVTVKGPKGQLSIKVDESMNVNTEGDTIIVKRSSDDNHHKALHGLTRSLVANMVIGVSDGFTRNLELVGVGYRAQQQAAGVQLSVMLSHNVTILPPEGVQIQVEGQNLITISGIDKQKVGQIAAQIRKVRPPNPYTGKGIRYQGEQVKLKAGKAGRSV
ncbi:MAG: 50S ribosomal protein L6 [Dehalococcoidia bacterium]|nr:50S ribosomal protein L6 [Dehalococcoidia bacterium]